MATKCVGPHRATSNPRSCLALSIASELFASLDTKVARAASKALKTGNHQALVDLKVNPSDYTSASFFHRDWIAVNLLGKFPSLQLNIDTKDVAEKGFLAGEIKCRSTNDRLKRPYDTPTLGVSGESLIESARLKIQALLGDFSWNDAEPFFGFSTGASTRLKRDQGDPIYKFEGKPHVTRRAALLASCAIRFSQLWHEQMVQDFGPEPSDWFEIVPGSRLSTVAKNAKTDRMIAVEPCMNMYLQRGCGYLLRKRLKTVGINLDSQVKNQELARIGSIDGSLATIDLAAASDTISTEIVRRLLPPSWFEAFDLIRCESGRFSSGTVVRFEKFSSMGNGFTFELESLIFWALSRAVVDHVGDSIPSVVAVYGDDIIVPSAAAGALIELLSYCGFDCNVEKTFVSGPFRESCGKHYFHGTDVTPLYIRKEIKGLARIYWVINSIRRLSERNVPGYCEPRFYSLWASLVELLPIHHRRFIPEGIGDVGIVATFSEARPRMCRSTMLWEVKTFLEVSGDISDVGHRPSALLRLYSGRAFRANQDRTAGETVDMTSLVINRSRIKGRSKRTLLLQWTDPGIWVV